MDVTLTLRTGSSKALLLTPAQPHGCLVVAHGAGNDRRYSFAPFFQAALERGFQVLSFDLPGHGRGNTSLLEVEHAAEDFAEAVLATRRALGNPSLPWILVGNSLGGALSLRAVSEGLLEPAGVVGIGMPARLDLGPMTTLGEIPSLCSRAMRRYRPYVSSWAEVFPSFGPFRRGEFPVRVDRPRYLDAVGAILNRPWGPDAPRCPVLLAQGSRDAVARARETRRLVEQLRAWGTEAALEIVPGVGHLDVMLHPRVQTAVLDWASDRVIGGVP